MTQTEGAISICSIAVIGAGTAGRAFALACARAGYAVVLEDVMPEKLRRAQDEYGQMADELSGSLRYALTVEDAVVNADIAIDFVPDELESKLEIFSLLDRMAPPRTIICTPTNALSITDLASCTYRAERCVGIRGAGIGWPLLLDGAVELMRSKFLSAAVEAAVMGLWGRLGMEIHVVADVEPMLVKNLPG